MSDSKKPKRKRRKPEQIINQLRQADALLAAGASIAQICQKLEVSEATYHRWQTQFGGMKADEARRLAKLETENKRLKKLLADSELDKDILKEAIDFMGKS